MRNFIKFFSVLLTIFSVAGMPPARAEGPGEAPADNAAAANGAVASLPRVLTAQDAAVYRQMFQLAAAGDWNNALALIHRVDDDILVGHVLAERYLEEGGYRASFDELSAWLARYPDHPDAQRIYALAVSVPPAGEALSGLPRPVAPRSMPGVSEPSPAETVGAARPASEMEPAAGSVADFQHHLAGGRNSPVAFDGGATAAADEVSAEEAAITDSRSPEANWTAGLAAWRTGAFTLAARRFEAAARRGDATPWTTSAAAFWAARARLHDRQPQKVNEWLAVAASYPRTFYGLLARRILGLPMPFNAQGSEDEGPALRALARMPAGKRALALMQVQEVERSRRELVALAGGGSDPVTRGVLVVADLAGMTDVAVQVQSTLRVSRSDDADSFPVPGWAPRDGFRIDKALLLALVRQESNFNPHAVSPMGARGLMQLMPSTARFVSARAGLPLNGTHALSDPEVNLTLGQKYVEMLLSNDTVGGDLFRFAVAWNAGPGNLEKWYREVAHEDDPLLFIEMIPARETRNFIEKVATNFWIYRYRMGQATPSLDALAAGTWPTYAEIGSTPLELARDG